MYIYRLPIYILLELKMFYAHIFHLKFSYCVLRVSQLSYPMNVQKGKRETNIYLLSTHNALG